MVNDNSRQNEITFEMVTTKGGDKGKTSLYDGTRVRKDHRILQFLGTMDTFTSFLGLTKAKLRNSEFIDKEMISDFIEDVQKRIILLNGMVASPNLKKPPKALPQDSVKHLEKFEKKIMEQTKIKPEFILQGKNELSALCDIARTYCRQAERAIIWLIIDENRIELQLPQKFLNRLSDVLYIIARYIDQVL